MWRISDVHLDIGAAPAVPLKLLSETELHSKFAATVMMLHHASQGRCRHPNPITLTAHHTVDNPNWPCQRCEMTQHNRLRSQNHSPFTLSSELADVDVCPRKRSQPAPQSPPLRMRSNKYAIRPPNARQKMGRSNYEVSQIGFAAELGQTTYFAAVLTSQDEFRGRKVTPDLNDELTYIVWNSRYRQRRSAVKITRINDCLTNPPKHVLNTTSPETLITRSTSADHLDHVLNTIQRPAQHPLLPMTIECVRPPQKHSIHHQNSNEQTNDRTRLLSKHT